MAGNAAARTLKMRCEDLAELIPALMQTETCINEFLMPLHSIYERLKGESRVGRMFEYMAAAYSADTPKLWEEGLEFTALSAEDKREVMRLAEVLGNGGRQHQKKHIELCLEKLKASLDSAEERLKLDGELYRKLGAYAGILAAIILF